MATSYVKELQAMLPDAKDIEQVGSNKMAIVTQADSTIVLYSYETLVGRLYRNTWYLTTMNHSQTTTKQLKKFAKEIPNNVEWVDSVLPRGEK